MAERTDLKILGRVIGTYKGFDVQDEAVYVFYEFKPDDPLTVRGMIAGDLTVAYDSGVGEVWDDTGALVWTADLVDLLTGLPKET